MKKNYIKPNMEVIILQKQNMILMASIREVSVRNTNYVDDPEHEQFEDL